MIEDFSSSLSIHWLELLVRLKMLRTNRLFSIEFIIITLEVLNNNLLKFFIINFFELLWRLLWRVLILNNLITAIFPFWVLIFTISTAILLLSALLFLIFWLLILIILSIPVSISISVTSSSVVTVGLTQVRSLLLLCLISDLCLLLELFGYLLAKLLYLHWTCLFHLLRFFPIFFSVVEGI